MPRRLPASGSRTLPEPTPELICSRSVAAREPRDTWNGSIVSNDHASGRRFRARRSEIAVLAAVLIGLLVITGCRSEEPTPTNVENGDPERGVELIQEYGCGECHRIPGVEGAEGREATGLQLWANRAVLVGGLPNNPDNVIRFIRDPDGIRPGTEMPDLGLSEEEARHITAYLFTLQ